MMKECDYMEINLKTILDDINESRYEDKEDGESEAQSKQDIDEIDEMMSLDGSDDEDVMNDEGL